MVKGISPSDVRDELDSMGVGEGGSEWEDGSLAQLLALGDFYAVEAEVPNQWDVEFYICQCEEVVHSVGEAFEDGYGVKFAKNDMAVKGRWFQPVPGRTWKYVYNETAPASYSHANSIVHIRFPVSPCESNGRGGARTYTIDSETVIGITSSLGR